MICKKKAISPPCRLFQCFQNIAPLQVGGIDAIDAIVAIEDMGFWGCGLGGMEEIKKSGGGDVRAKALSWDDEWDKA